MPPTQPPTFLLVTGSFALPSMYEPVLSLLPRHLTLHVPHLRTVSPGRDRSGTVPAPTMSDDAAYIASEIRKLADDKGTDIVLLAHSYGGVPMSECLGLEGVVKSERAKEGKRGGVVRAGYLTCLVPEVGGTAMGVLGEVKEEDRLVFKVLDDGWMYHEDLNRTRDVVCSNMKPEDADPWFANWPRHSAISFAGELTHAGYKNVPVSYLLCEGDRCVPPDVQRKGIETIEKASGSKVDVTSVAADHAPNVSAPQTVVNWIVKMAEMESS